MGPLLCQDKNDSILCKTDIGTHLKTFYIKTYNTACDFAIQTTHTNKLQIDYFDVYYDISDEPVSCIFEYVYTKESKLQYFTLGISLNSEKLAIEFYYFDVTTEKKWKETLKVTDGQKIVVCNSGTYLKKSDDEYVKYPENQLYDKYSLLEVPKILNRESYIPIKKSSLQSSSDKVSIKAGNNRNASEVIVPGVPNYLWYLNCGLTTHTMLIGYWNDKGYSNFIPGGNSTNGHYWAVTEELCKIGGIANYARAYEYGNNSSFRFNYFYRPSYSKDEFWNLYTKMIDSTQNPMEVNWWGDPYGAHSTLGVGYKVDGDQRFLILNDTWRSVSYYVNFNEYYESISGFQHSYPETKKTEIDNVIQLGTINSQAAISLESLILNISPPLDPEEYSYHSFELADLNGDQLEDLVVCNFRSFTKGIHIYYNNGTTFIEDAQFNPHPKNYQCTGISRTFDFDNDGDLDIAVAGFLSSNLNLFVNEGGSIKQAPIIVDSIGFFNAPPSFNDLECGDFDQDSDIDIISSTDFDQIRWYRNQNGIFNNELTFSLINNSFNSIEKIKLSDVNNDSYPDLIASSRKGTILLFYNNKGYFKAAPDFSPKGHGGIGFDVADLNNDSWPDIVTSDDGKIIIYQNNLGVFKDNPQHVNDNLDCFPKDFTITDLNNDNYPEIVVANYNRPNIILANNQGQIDPTPVWQSAEVDPTINVRVFDNDKGERRLLFGKARGGNLEFYKVNLITKVLSVTPSNQDAGSDVGSARFNISSNTSWTVSDDADWLTVSPIIGNNDGTITATFTANPLPISRVGTITISGIGASPQTVTISQKGKVILSVAPTNQDVGLEAGSTTFYINSNTAWTITDDANWLTVTPLSGNGNATITVTFIANPMAASSIGTIIVSCQGLSSQSVTVSQSRQTGVTTLDGNRLWVYPNPAKDFVTIKFDDTIGSDFSISVTDALGKSHYVNEYKGTNQEIGITVDLTSLKSGLYFIIVNSQHAIKTYKIIKE